MIVIYTQDETYIRNDAEDAKNVIFSLYGRKFGEEAYNVIKGGRIGATYRKYGGPLVRVVTKEDAEIIRQKEGSIA